MPVLLFEKTDHPEITYDDAFLVPFNSTEDHVRAAITPAERGELDELARSADEAEAAIVETDEASIAKSVIADQNFRRKLLELAERYGIGKILSRDQVDFRPEDGFGNTPFVVANMNQVTGKRMAEVAARMGGTAALPQDMDDDELTRIAEYLRTRNVDYATPVTVSPADELHHYHRVLAKRDVDTAIVVDDEGRLSGILNQADILSGASEDHKVSDYMRRSDVTTVPEGTDLIEAYSLMKRANVSCLPVIGNDGKVVGVLTKKFIAARLMYEPHLNAETGGLAMLGTIGAVNKNPIDRARLLIDLGVRGIVLDTAHFDQGIETYRNLEVVRDLVEQSRKNITLIAGNVVTPEAVKNIIAAGGDIAKVGIGPGAVCTTRMETGTGKPQLSAVLDCAEMARKKGKHIWADGGIKYPRDVALALAAGASQVMIGSSLCPTIESPPAWEPVEVDGKKRGKRQAGMASRQMAQLRGTNGVSPRRRIIDEVFGPRSEGASNVLMKEKPGMPSVVDIINWTMRGVTSAMTYAGAANLQEFRRYARINIQHASGFNEGKALS